MREEHRMKKAQDLGPSTQTGDSPVGVIEADNVAAG